MIRAFVLGAALLFAVTPIGKNAWAECPVGELCYPGEAKQTPFCDEAPGAKICLDRPTGFVMFDWREPPSPATKDDIDAINKRLDDIERMLRDISDHALLVRPR